MKTPLVSVIVPVYKVEPYIRQALNSIINQTYRNLQIILVDDGSPDNCGKICDEYAEKDSRVTVIHKKNGGVSSARNAGIDAADGEWIYFMDPDDWIEPETLSVCVEKALETDTDMVTFNYDRFNGKRLWGKRLAESRKSKMPRLYDPTDYEASTYILTGGVCYCVTRASLIKNRMKFDTDLQYREDIFFKFLLWKEIRSFCVLPNVFYHYRQTPDSATTRRDFLRLYEEQITAHKKFQILFQTVQYPEKAHMLENTGFVSGLIGLMTGVLLDNSRFSFCEKKKAILSIVGMEEFQAVMREEKPTLITWSSKVFFSLHQYPVTATYIVYFLKKTKNLLQLI